MLSAISLADKEDIAGTSWKEQRMLQLSGQKH